MNKYQKLFEPINIGKLRIKNRTSMAPMGLICYADDNGGFNEEAQDYYIERAKGGVGLIITGVCFANYVEIPENATPCPTYNPLMFNKSVAPMIEKIHAYDSKIFLQVTGGLGRSAMPNFIKKAYAPSENSNRFEPTITHEEMTNQEVKQLINDFIASAVVAQTCGFDGIEIHAVHEGYLLDQFAISLFNHRSDEYGGSLENRLRIATDIVKGIKAACGEDFPVSIRYSLKSFMKGLRQGGLPGETFDEVGRDYEEGLEAAKILVDAGYDILNVDVGTYDSWYWNHPPMYFEEGMYREFGRMIKEVVDVPVILAGRMDNPDVAIDALNGCCDIVSYGRPLLADPHLVNKIKTNQLDDIRPCLSCHDGCMGRIAHGLPLSCAVNPSCGRETKYGITKAMKNKKVLVIGGGVAGMESARICALRGHDVTLIESNSKLGGNIISGSVPDFKSDDRRLIAWYEKQLRDLNVEVKLNTLVTKEMIEKFGCDEVVMATGSNPIMLDFDKNNVVHATEVLLGEKPVTDEILVMGGGLVGCETALWLAKQGKKVTVVEMADDILGGPHGMPFMNYDMLKDLLAFNDVKVMLNSKVVSVEDDYVVVETDSKTQNVNAKTVVVAVGFKSENELEKELNTLPLNVHNIGDSKKVVNIMHAIWDAYEVARSI